MESQQLTLADVCDAIVVAELAADAARPTGETDLFADSVFGSDSEPESNADSGADSDADGDASGADSKAPDDSARVVTATQKTKAAVADAARARALFSAVQSALAAAPAGDGEPTVAQGRAMLAALATVLPQRLPPVEKSESGKYVDITVVQKLWVLSRAVNEIPLTTATSSFDEALASYRVKTLKAN